MKPCILDENKICDGCGGCDRCDLDPNKICDNCCKCIEQEGVDYAKIPVMDVVTEDVEGYLSALQGLQEEGEARFAIPYEEIDPALLRYWEEQLKDVESPGAKPMRGVRKRRERH